MLQVEDHSDHRWIYCVAWIKSSSLFLSSLSFRVRWNCMSEREKEKRRDVNLFTENQEEVSFLSLSLSLSDTQLTTRNPWEKVQGIFANKGKISASVLAQASGSSINQSKEPKCRPSFAKMNSLPLFLSLSLSLNSISSSILLQYIPLFHSNPVASLDFPATHSMLVPFCLCERKILDTQSKPVSCVCNWFGWESEKEEGEGTTHDTTQSSNCFQ